MEPKETDGSEDGAHDCTWRGPASGACCPADEQRKADIYANMRGGSAKERLLLPLKVHCRSRGACVPGLLRSGYRQIGRRVRGVVRRGVW